MSMDLVPVNPTAQYPRPTPFRLEDVSEDEIADQASHRPETLSFSYRYWAMLLELFSEFGVDIASSSNDGEEIPEWTCLEVADALEARLDDFITADQPFIRHLILCFRNSGGFRQSTTDG
jgi:hypothetical protein